MRTRRFILLLDPRYREERELLEVIKAAPKGEQAAFIRALMLMGFRQAQAQDTDRDEAGKA